MQALYSVQFSDHWEDAFTSSTWGRNGENPSHHLTQVFQMWMLLLHLCPYFVNAVHSFPILWVRLTVAYVCHLICRELFQDLVNRTSIWNQDRESAQEVFCVRNFCLHLLARVCHIFQERIMQTAIFLLLSKAATWRNKNSLLCKTPTTETVIVLELTLSHTHT